MRQGKRLPQVMRAIAFALATLLATTVTAWAQDAPPQQIELGARLYAENCVVCHGERGEGRVGATLAKNWPSIRPDLRIRETIADGVPGSPMPAWSQAKGGPLTDEEIDALVAYILSWESGQPFTPPAIPTPTPRPPVTPVPNVEGDPNRGALLYDQNCAVCHGRNGEGRIGATLAKAWPALRPDLAIRNTIAHGVPGSPMPAWSQANGGPLSEQDIDDIVAFVLTWAEAAEATEAPQQVLSTRGAALPIIGALLLSIVVIGLVIWYIRRPPAEGSGPQS
ncbi:MAG: hypothetical protein Kow0047_13650 [Anaerolineae bacterium]